MNNEQLYDHLNQAANNNDTRRQLFVSFLRSCAHELEAHPDNLQSIAYEIAGLMSTDYALSLDDTDPINNVLTIAGELEILSDNQKSRHLELITAINALT